MYVVKKFLQHTHQAVKIQFSCNVASEIITRRNTKLVAIVSEVLNTSIDCIRSITIAFTTVDGFDCCTESRINDIVNFVHPKPQGSLERHH